MQRMMTQAGLADMLPQLYRVHERERILAAAETEVRRRIEEHTGRTRIGQRPAAAGGRQQAAGGATE